MIFRRINALAIVRKLAGTTVNANQVEVLTRTWASGGRFDTNSTGSCIGVWDRSRTQRAAFGGPEEQFLGL